MKLVKKTDSERITKNWFDEFADWPNYKWYRNPIKWYKWRKTMKEINALTKTNNL